MFRATGFGIGLAVMLAQSVGAGQSTDAHIAKANAAAWGGTAFNWQSGSPTYITPERPAKFWYDTYIASARRFRDIVSKAGADVLIANHANFDGSKTKQPALARRKPAEPHPCAIGTDAVQRYLTVAEECALAMAAR